MKKLLWLLAGGHPFLLAISPTSQFKYTLSGLAIILTGVLAGTAAGYAVYGALGGSLLGTFLIAFLWAILIVTIDSVIVGSIETADNDWQKWKVVLPRVLLASAIAIIIARPLELKLFEREIKTVIVEIELQRCQNMDSHTISALTESLRKEEEALKLKRWDISAAEKAKALEPQNAPLYQEKLNTLQLELADLEKKTKKLREQILAINSRSCDPKAISEQFKQQIPSFLESNIALAELSDKKPAAKMIIWSITLLFILIELVPIVVKLMDSNKDSIYKQQLKTFEDDLKKLNYLELLKKYPLLELQGEHLFHLKKKDAVYNDLLSVYAQRAKEERFVEHERQMIEIKHEAEIKSQEIVNATVAEKLKNAQIEIVERLVALWKKATVQEIEQNPANYVDLPNTQPSQPNEESSKTQDDDLDV